MPALLAATDAWVSSSSSRAHDHQLASPASTPTKRASRSSRISNDTDHAAFSRTSVDPSTGLESTLEFRVGDTVVVSDQAKLRQKFLAPPTYLVPTKPKGKSKAKGKGKQRAQDDEDEEQQYDGWRHEDGLRAGDKVAVITRLFEDVRGRMMATVRWFARPGAVWGEQGPDEDHDAFGEVMPYELYFTSDSTHLQESRLLREKAAFNPFSSSSPSSSPSKSRSRSSAALVSSPSRAASAFVSSAACFRTPLHSDAIPVSTIVSSAEVFSPSALDNATITAAQQRPLPMFVCTRVYDVKPVPGAGFWGEIDFDEVRRRAVEWYEDKMRGGEREVAQDAWDVEPVMEDSDEEEDSEHERKREERRKARADKARATRERKEKERLDRGAASGDESTDDDSDDEDTFAASNASSSSDDDDGNSDDESSSSDSEAQSGDEGDVLRTPTKRKARSTRQLPTPSSSSRGSSHRAAATTNKAKRARTSAAESGRQAKRRRFAAKSSRKGGASSGTSSGALSSSPTALPPLLQASELAKLSPFDRAKALLHVSATPEALPCREEQRERIRQFLGDAILGRTGGCLYVHGVPGTGKTATVHSVVRELQKDEDMDAFTFVEINGMKISEPMAAFSHLWSALAPPEHHSPRKTSPKAALAALEHHFANPDPARQTTVVLVDELDQMLTKRQDVLYNFFNWPHVAHSRLVVVAVANTMDLPERELSGKIRSRLGTNRIPFQPYTWMELKRILEARLALVALPSSDASSSTTATTKGPAAPPLFDDVALQKIAKSVAGISGDARKALDVARRTLDRVALRLAASPSPSSAPGPLRCTIQDATQAYNDMTRQGPSAVIRRLSTHAKVLLLALAQCARRAGVPDVELDTVLAWHGNFVRQTAHAAGAGAGVGAGMGGAGQPSRGELVGVVAQLHALRLVAAESQRLDVFQRVRACVDEGDLFAALREDEHLKAHVPKVL